MKEAVYYKKLKGKMIKCTLCPWNCRLAEGQSGFCNTRVNVNGRLFSIIYGEPSGFQADPIEKKPFFHFNPGSTVLSFGTQGCNFKCEYCCNYFYSQSRPKSVKVRIKPEDIVDKAVSNGCEGIAFTYNEPSIFMEYAIDVMRLSRERGLFNVFVTNGCVNKKPLLDASPFLDAVVIDFKGFNPVFYRDYVHGKLDWVKDSLINYSKLDVHIEVTNLLVPGLNDESSGIREFSKFVFDQLGPNTPVHFLKFFPMFRMNDVPETPLSLIEEAVGIAHDEGLRYVYAGNTGEGINTYCPYCGELLVLRAPNQLINSFLNGGKCPECDEIIHINGVIKVNDSPRPAVFG